MWLLIGRPYMPANRLASVNELIHGKGVPEEEVINRFDQKYRFTDTYFYTKMMQLRS